MFAKLKQKIKEAEGDASELGVEVAEERRPEALDSFERLKVDIPAMVAPDGAENSETYFKVGDEYTRTLYIHTYPPQVDDNWLREILHYEEAVDCGIYIQPIPIKPFLDELRRQVNRDEAAIESEREDGRIPNQRRVARWRDNHAYITAIEEGHTKPFQIMVAITLRARSLPELERITAELEGSLTQVSTRQTRFQHRQGFLTTLPLMHNEIADMLTVRPMHTQGLMAMFPFTSSGITHPSGVIVGIAQGSNTPILINRFLQASDLGIDNPNACILGATGSGKSMFAKLEMLRYNYQGVPVITLDPSGEYSRVCNALGGQDIVISLDSADRINPLDFSPSISRKPGANPLRQKIAYMFELLRVMIRSDDEHGHVPIDAVTRQIFDTALQNCYAQYGYDIRRAETQWDATSERMPTLEEVYLMLARIAKTNVRPEVRERLVLLLPALENYVGDGALAPLFDHRSTVDLRSDFINFNYSQLPQAHLPLAMHLVLEYLRTTLFTDEQQTSGIPRLLYVDEAQKLMAFTETAHFLDDMARTCRKYNVGLTVMTQNVGTFVLNDDGSENRLGQGILAQCSTKVLLKQETSEAENIQRVFQLTPGELTRLLGARRGEGVLKVGREVAWFSAQGLASEMEYQICTTTAAERAAIAALQAGDQQERAPELPRATADVCDGQIGYRALPPVEDVPGFEQPTLPPVSLPPPAAEPEPAAEIEEDPFADTPFASDQLGDFEAK